MMADFDRLKSELRKTLHSIMMEESKSWLIRSLLRNKIATWDIYKFAENQADLRTSIKSLDWPTMNTALRAKLKDIKQTLIQEKKKKSKVEYILEHELRDRNITLKQLMNPWKKDIRKEKVHRILTLKKKVVHLKNKQRDNTADVMEKKEAKTHPPKFLSEYNNLRIFSTSENFPKGKTPTGPFVGSSSIKLSKGELRLLSRHPKYSIRTKVDVDEYKIEVEKMNAKRKYDLQTLNNNDNGGSINIVELKAGGVLDPSTELINKKEASREEELKRLWEEERDRVVFDPILNKVNFNNRRPTDYKHNKRIILPKPAPIEIELECDRRRRKYLQVLDMYKAEIKKKKKQSCHKDEKNIEKKGENDIKERHPKRKKEKSEIDNLSDSEQKGLKSLKKRVREGELVLTTTDKSGRMAVLSREQYIEAGKVHTEKDELLDWKTIHYLQNQINSHTWWSSKIFGNSKNTDQTRMGKNTMETSYQIPEMSLLVKDHKVWSEEEKKPVPSRPVLSGNSCLNTHLSELVSEILEPISTRITSAEITSTEEALNKLTELNELVKTNGNWMHDEKYNILTLIGQEEDYISNILDSLVNEQEIIRGGLEGQIEPDEGPDTLSSQNLGPVSDTLPSPDPRLASLSATNQSRPDNTNRDGGKNKQTRLDDFWPNTLNNFSSNVSGACSQSSESHGRELDLIERELRKKSKNAKAFSEKIELATHASIIWGRKFDELEHCASSMGVVRQNSDVARASSMGVVRQNSDVLNETVNIGTNVARQNSDVLNETVNIGTDVARQISDLLNETVDSDKLRVQSNISVDSEASDILPMVEPKPTQHHIPPLQNLEEKPIIIGADVSALYPSMIKEVTGELVYRAVTKTDIEFEGLDYDFMAVYLFLVLGTGLMLKCGLESVIPVRKNKSKARSLLALSNRDIHEWNTKPQAYTQEIKRKMLGRMLQILTIVLMSSSCYSFAGDIYRQVNGAGIGERGSACLAKIIMSLWDKLWAKVQSDAGLFSPLFIRYVDDIRIYLHPINDGWKWVENRWMYNEAFKDNRSYHERTKENIRNSLNGLLEGIELTVETELDFINGMLPTLDFQTRVRDNGEIEFLHFKKPMASGLVVQKGTALGKQTVFASLRQDLIRRLSHVSSHFGINEHVKIVEDFTQSLADSGHNYSFAKSIILQALTRFKTMKIRSQLDSTDVRFLPLYRNRLYDFDRRSMIKKTLGRTWYTGKNFGDIFKQEWKRRLKRKGGRKYVLSNRGERKPPPPSTVMFVPSTDGGVLLNMLEKLEQQLWKDGDSTWSVKLVEQSGKQLRYMFTSRMPIAKGCPLGKDCIVCDDDAVKCSSRGVVYLAECLECQDVIAEKEINGASLSNSWYVGETSRPLRMRAREHWNKLQDLDVHSFIFTHWMKDHGLSMFPPKYTFKILGTYSDSLSRQIAEAIHIETKGILNKKSEFGTNHIPRLEAAKSERDRDAILEKEAKDRANLLSDLVCFRNVITNVVEIEEKKNCCAL